MLLTLNALIAKLTELSQKGYGDKIVVFDSFYNIDDAEYDSNEDQINLLNQ